MWIEVIPAYGNDYKNQKEIKEAWAADKDFQETASRSYTNKSGAEKLGLKVNGRYGVSKKMGNNTKVVTLSS